MFGEGLLVLTVFMKEMELAKEVLGKEDCFSCDVEELCGANT